MLEQQNGIGQLSEFIFTQVQSFQVFEFVNLARDET